MFEILPALPEDPILGLMAAYRQDPNPQKVDLGVGVYRDDDGNTPILECVLAAQRRHNDLETTKSYIGPPGDADFNVSMQRLLFGEDHAALSDQRVCSAQTPGGCGALRVAAELVNRAKPAARIWVSDTDLGQSCPLTRRRGPHDRYLPLFRPSDQRTPFRRHDGNPGQGGQR